RRAGVATRLPPGKEAYDSAAARRGLRRRRLTLSPLPQSDNDDYAWTDPRPDPASANNCANCHAAIYGEWSVSAHARSATNRRFRNLFDGTDWHGRPTKGWSLLAQRPDGAGACAACHAPTFR